LHGFTLEYLTIFRIDRYASLVTPTTAISTGQALGEQVQYQPQQSPASPTSSMAANVSTSEPMSSPYQPFLAQAARLPPTHSSLNDLTAYNTNTSREIPRRQSQSNSLVSSTLLTGLMRDPSWPIDGFPDLHVSGSEPKIFPGALSRAQRRDSLARERKGSISENDDNLGMTFKRGKENSKSKYDKLVMEDDKEISDRETEEAGGRDDLGSDGKFRR
jgi:AMP deaminase